MTVLRTPAALTRDPATGETARHRRRRRAVATAVAALVQLAGVPMVAGVAPLGAQASSATGTLPTTGRRWVAQNAPRGLIIVWDLVPGAKGYRLYQLGTSSGGADRLLATAASNANQYIVNLRNDMMSVPLRYAIETLDAAGLPSARAEFNVVTPVEPGAA